MYRLYNKEYLTVPVNPINRAVYKYESEISSRTGAALWFGRA